MTNRSSMLRSVSMIRVTSRLVATTALLVAAAPAGAVNVKGAIVFPPPSEASSQAARAHPLAHWRVENGVIPIAPALPEPRDGVVVVLESQQAPPTGARPELRPEGEKIKVMILEVRPMRVEPRLLVVEAGAALALRNADKAPRTFYLENGESFVPRQATAPGADRDLKFTERGEYHLVDAEHPRAGALVVVVGSPYHAVSDERGTFSVDVPDGKYFVKALYRGAWTAPQPLEVAQTKGREVTVKLPAPTPDPDTKGAPATQPASPAANDPPGSGKGAPTAAKVEPKPDKKPDPKAAKKGPAKKVEKK